MVRKKRNGKKGAGKPNTQTLDDLLQDQGFELATSGSYAMPFLRILQKLSPECDKDESAHIKGAKAGMILHTVQKTVHKTVNLIPLKYKDTYIEWVTRANGGGFVQEYDALDPIVSELLAQCKRVENATILPNGNELKLHSNYFCAFQTLSGEFEPIMVSFSSSQLKTSRIWLSTLRGMTLKVNGKNVPAKNIRSYQWEFSTEKLSNDKGTWYGWTYEQLDDTRLLESVGPMQQQVDAALTANLLTYDRSQQQGTDTDNAL